MAKLDCPSCGASLTLRRSLTAGQKLRCPECQTLFLPASEPEVLRESALLARHRLRSNEADEPDSPAWENEERPRLTRHRPRRKTTTGTSWLIGLILAGTLLLAGLVAVGGFLWLRGTDRGNRETGSAAALTPDGWVEITSLEGGFTVWMPAGTVEKRGTRPSMVGLVPDAGFHYAPEGTNITYGVSLVEFTPDQLRQASLEQIVQDWRDSSLRNWGGQVESERVLELDGHRGWEFLLRLRGQSYLWLRCYAVGTRVYTLGVSSIRAGLDSPEVQAFFDSFRLTDGTP